MTEQDPAGASNGNDEEPLSLEDEIRRHLEVIDREMSDSNVSIPMRPFEAARLFVDVSVLEIKGDTKEDYLGKPWFKAIYATAREWYGERYGEAAVAPPSVLRGAVLHAGVLFELRIPTTLRRVEDPGRTSWLVFPTSVNEGEEPLDWIQRPPNLAVMNPDAKGRLRQDVAEVGCQLRLIRADTSAAIRPDAEAEGLAEKISPHLSASAEHLGRTLGSGLALACWEAHQSVESVLKLLIRQETGAHPRTHEVQDLHDRLRPPVRATIDGVALQQIPSAQRAIQMRAGEGVAVLLPEAYSTYRAALRLVSQYSDRLRYKMRGRNGAFLLAKLPWLGD